MWSPERNFTYTIPPPKTWVALKADAFLKCGCSVCVCVCVCVCVYVCVCVCVVVVVVVGVP